MKILVVDDHPLIMEDIMDELKGIAPDAFVTGTSSSAEVLGLCDENRFDVIFMDIDMPGTNGLILAKEILKKYPRTNKGAFAAPTASAFTRGQMALARILGLVLGAGGAVLVGRSKRRKKDEPEEAA